MSKLVFIDTNIFLDFYRFRNSDISMKYLELIDNNKNLIITSSQVEMEYKKHRAEELRKTFDLITLPNWNTLTPPAILSDSEPAQIIERHKKDIAKQQKKLKDRILKVFNDPVRHDRVFQCAQRLFRDTMTDINLNRENDERFRIRRLALKRFMLGYPPRKQGDTSIGDAINWEWIIDCAKRRNCDVIIVSRDSDYGQHLSTESFINEWLFTEFKERISKKKKVILTNKLAIAFREAVSKRSVTKKMENAEQEIILEERLDDSQVKEMTAKDKLRALQETIDRLERTWGKSE